MLSVIKLFSQNESKPVAKPGFPEGGGAPVPDEKAKTYYLTRFVPKAALK